MPRWLAGSGRGWVTAEYGMLPASTGRAQGRATRRAGKQDGRTVEIQRLIGRSLRAVVDFEALGERTVYLDCDVLQADGGTRCASITGAYVAFAPRRSRLARCGRARAHAADGHGRRGLLSAWSMARRCWTSTTPRTRAAEVDANVVMTGDGRARRGAGDGRAHALSRASLDELLALAARGHRAAAEVQRAAIAVAR